jgi:hypothetical protein
MRLYGQRAKGQAQPVAGSLRHGPFEACIGLEDLLPRFGRDAGTQVRDSEPQPLCVCPGFEADLGARRAYFRELSTRL